MERYAASAGYFDKRKLPFLKLSEVILGGSECLASYRQKGNSEDSIRRKLTGLEFPTSKFPNIVKIYVSLNQMVFPPCRLVRTASWWSIYEISSQPLKREVALCIQHCPRALRSQVDSLYLESILYSSVWSSSNECPVQLLLFRNILNSPGKVITIYPLKTLSLLATLFEFGTRGPKSCLMDQDVNFCLHLASQAFPLKYLKPPEQIW